MKFRKKPVVIEAVQWSGKPDQEWPETWRRDAELWPTSEMRGMPARVLHIVTLEGEMRASPGDWIIKGIKGEFYPCRDDIFRMTYEPADGA